MDWNSAQEWLTQSWLVRRTAEAVLAAAGRRHLARLDRLAPARCQRRILLGLIHKAQATHFGRDHDFRRIRNIADYRRLVPLRSRAELWREYGEEWPSLPLQSHSACHRAALRTALAVARHLRPHARLLSGDLLFVTEEGPSSHPDGVSLSQRLPALIRPYTLARAEVEAERFATLSVTCLIGPAERLLRMMKAIEQVRGKSCIRDIWPRLSTILYTRLASDLAASRLRAEAGSDVLLLEMVGRSEGPIAVEDPQLGFLRLLFDHDVYFEFVPLEHAGEPRCPRFGIEEIDLGVPYELALTSPAGLWSCRLGRIVCLERRDPPLVRFLETAICKPDEARSVGEAHPSLTLQTLTPAVSHPQRAGTPAAPPGTAFHSPWSTLADRG